LSKQREIDIRSERGQTMVEFALVLPFFCLLLFGIIQFGIIWNNYVTLTDAARAGARKAVVSKDEAAAEAAVRHSAGNLPGAQSAERCPPAAEKLLGVTVTPATTSWDPGSDVTVCAMYKPDLFFADALRKFGVDLPDLTLRAETTERIE
jgi:Flp pilus assembly protein TadG